VKQRGEKSASLMNYLYEEAGVERSETVQCGVAGRVRERRLVVESTTFVLSQSQQARSPVNSAVKPVTPSTSRYSSSRRKAPGSGNDQTAARGGSPTKPLTLACSARSSLADIRRVKGVRRPRR
jgi:hypothetical protein